MTAPVGGALRGGSLAALVSEVHERLGRFDAAACTGEQAAEVVVATVAIVRRCEAVRLAALARVEETDAWRSDGSRSCRAWVMRTLDTSYFRAGQLLDTATRLRSQPHVDRLAAGGLVDIDKVLLASATVAVRPDAAIDVCHAAEHSDRKSFRARCRRWRQAGETDEERAARHHRDRRARLGVDDEGMVELRAAGPADEGAELRSLFQPWVDDLLRDSWVRGPP